MQETIVKDPEFTLQEAKEISDKMMTVMHKEVKKFSSEDDPAENIYLVLKITNFVLFQIFLSLQKYCETYGIEKFTSDLFMEYIKKSINDGIIIFNNK